MDILSDVLQHSSLIGGINFCHSFNHKWGLNVAKSKGGIFHILISGKASLGYNGNVIPINEGDIVVFPYGDPHWIAYEENSLLVPSTDIVSIYQNHRQISDHKTELSTLLCGYFDFSDPAKLHLFKELPGFLHIESNSEKHFQWLKVLVKKMNVEALVRGAGSELYLNRLVEVLVIDIFRHWLSSTKHLEVILKAANEPLIHKVVTLFHSHPDTNFQLDMLAKDIGMSRATLTRKFTKLLGSSPMNYLAIWRIHKACNLLRTSHLSLLEIALAVGFQSDSALSKKFRAEIGVSPGAFRKQYQ